MHDPFALSRPELVAPYVQPLADFLSLKTLPLHFHEVLFAFALYHCTNKYLAPAFSRTFFPRVYPSFNARTKLNWDVHIVSFVQSTLICSLAFFVIWQDDERGAMDSLERVHGYTGASGLIQAFAAGYFLWDLMITLQNVQIFGIGMLFHAISALCVFSLGFRPFVNFYAPTFILYELSSPFLNIHWFCDKLNMTGGTVQLVNGIFLLSTFFSCRILWGTYQSICVFGDVYHLINTDTVTLSDPEFGKLNNSTVVGNAGFKHGVLRFAEGQTVPVWLAGAYLTSNIILNGLNWFWFGKMIETIRKRFDPPLGTRRPETKNHLAIPEEAKVLIEGISVVTPAALEKDVAEDYLSASTEILKEKTSTGTHLEINQTEVRSRKGGRRKA